MTSIDGEQLRIWRVTKRLSQDATAKLFNATAPSSGIYLTGPLVSMLETELVKPGPALEERLVKFMAELECCL